MFFPRLRRQAKWVFVFLALVFVLGFVVFGVGSGGGIGLGDLFNQGGGTKASVSESDARKRIEKNPQDAPAYRELATALETKGDMNGAASALRQFTKLRPRNTDGLSELAGLYASLGSRLQPQIDAAQTAAQQSSVLSLFNSGVQLGGRQVVEPNPIFQALSGLPNSRLSELYLKQQTDYTQAKDLYKRIVKIKPNDASAQLNLGSAAQSAGDTKTAIAAYERFVKLAPDDPTTPQIKRIIKALRKQGTGSPVATQGG